MKLNGILFETTNQSINQSQVSKRHKSMPRYSNLKLKPNLQADVVMFKGKENVLSQEQKALNNLNSLLKQNVINRELNDVLIKEVNAKNKNVVKYLNAIKASKDPSLKGHKAIAQRLVDNHAQISGAIASLKTVDDETKQKLDFDNQKTMVHGINEIYTKDKDVKTEETNGEIGFGGRKDAAKKIIREHVAIAGGGGAFIPEPIASAAALIGNEIVMTARVGKVYGYEGLKKALTAACGLGGGTMTSVATMPIAQKAAETLVPQLANMILQSAASIGVSSSAKIIPILGGIVNGGVAIAATAALGKAVLDIFETLT